MEQLGRDEREEVAEEGEGQGGRIHSGFGGDFFLKSQLVLIYWFCPSCSCKVFFRGWARDVGHGSRRQSLKAV